MPVVTRSSAKQKATASSKGKKPATFATPDCKRGTSCPKRPSSHSANTKAAAPASTRGKVASRADKRLQRGPKKVKSSIASAKVVKSPKGSLKKASPSSAIATSTESLASYDSEGEEAFRLQLDQLYQEAKGDVEHDSQQNEFLDDTFLNGDPLNATNYFGYGSSHPMNMTFANTEPKLSTVSASIKSPRIVGNKRKRNIDTYENGPSSKRARVESDGKRNSQEKAYKKDSESRKTVTAKASPVFAETSISQRSVSFDKWVEVNHFLKGSSPTSKFAPLPFSASSSHRTRSKSNFSSESKVEKSTLETVAAGKIKELAKKGPKNTSANRNKKAAGPSLTLNLSDSMDSSFPKIVKPNRSATVSPDDQILTESTQAAQKSWKSGTKSEKSEKATNKSAKKGSVPSIKHSFPPVTQPKQSRDKESAPPNDSKKKRRTPEPKLMDQNSQATRRHSTGRETSKSPNGKETEIISKEMRTTGWFRFNWW